MYVCPEGGVCPEGVWTDTPPHRMATAAVGMYPTGIHTCVQIIFLRPVDKTTDRQDGKHHLLATSLAVGNSNALRVNRPLFTI